MVPAELVKRKFRTYGRTFDNKRPAVYNADNPERGHRVRPGERALLHTAVGHFPAKGGEAYGRRAKGESSALPDMLHHYPCDNGLHISQSSLTARLAPERSTDLLMV